MTTTTARYTPTAAYRRDFWNKPPKSERLLPKPTINAWFSRIMSGELLTGVKAPVPQPVPKAAALSHKAMKVLRQMLGGRSLAGDGKTGYRLELIDDLGRTIRTKVKAGIVAALKAATLILYNGLAWLLTEKGKRAIVPSKFGKSIA